MSASKLRCVATACALAGMLAMPAVVEAGPILDWLCGNSPNMTAQTTYVAPYYAPAFEAPYATPACDSCSTPSCATPTFVTPASSCSSCAPQVVQYAPYAVYRPISVARSVTTYYYPGMTCNTCAAPTTTYYPTTACNTCAAPVTAYYAPLAWRQQVRMIPYTTYRMAYMPVTYVGYAPACSSCVAPCVSSCAAPCSCYGCGSTVTYGTSSCDSCQPAISSTYATPETQTPTLATPITSPSTPTEATPQPKTFQEQKPATEDTKPALQDDKTNAEPELKPIPHTETQLNSMPEPRLIDPENRTTALPLRQTVHLASRPSAPVEPALAPKSGGWRESRD
jgi:hypothetical protein